MKYQIIIIYDEEKGADFDTAVELRDLIEETLNHDAWECGVENWHENILTDVKEFNE
jgi:hypothetical protein